MGSHRLRTKDFRVVAVLLAMALVGVACTGGGGASSASDTTTTSPTLPPDVSESLPLIDESPSAPIGLVVVSTAEGQINLAWDASRDETVTGYEVTRVASTGLTEQFSTDAPTFTDDGLDDGDIFTYRVAAVGTGGTSVGSETVTARVGEDTNPPRRPGAPVTIETDEGIRIEWRASDDFSGIAGYVVTRTIDEESVEIETPTPFLLDDIEPAQVVTYRVRAVDTAGNESDETRAVTVLSGTPADRVVVVVSAVPDPEDDPQTERLQQALLNAGFIVSWFEDGVFDSNVTAADDVVLLLGDIESQGFDWNLFGTDTTIISLKSVFVEASGITAEPPKLDGLAQLDYTPPGQTPREVAMTNVVKPRNVVFIPAVEQLPDLEVWATTTWNSELAVAGLIPAGGELATDRPAPGCRSFFPGNRDSLTEQTDAAWELLIEFVDSIAASCR